MGSIRLTATTSTEQHSRVVTVPRASRRESPNVSALLALQRQAGNRAVTALLHPAPVQRWFGLADKSAEPNPGYPPKHEKQPADLKWVQNNLEPIHVYRFHTNKRGYEAPGEDQSFQRSKWHLEVAQSESPPSPVAALAPDLAAPDEWFNLTSGTWGNLWHDPPNELRYRLASKSERAQVPLRDFNDHGYRRAQDVPVYIMRKHRQIEPSPAQDRPAGLRMLDRFGRAAHSGLAGEHSPHLATTLTRAGQIMIAGNTGQYSVTPEQQAAVNARLNDYLDSAPHGQRGRREFKDRIKLHALMSGSYQEAHPEDPLLPRLAETLRRGTPLEWRNVTEKGSGGNAEHGEMTLLGKRLKEMRGNRKDPNAPQLEFMGGKLRACQACQWVYDAFNAHIGPQVGYRIAASGTHGKIFPGWLMPIWLTDEAREAVIKSAGAAGWMFKSTKGRLKLVPKPGGAQQEIDRRLSPDDSGSEWEEDVESRPGRRR